MQATGPCSYRPSLASQRKSSPNRSEGRCLTITATGPTVWDQAQGNELISRGYCRAGTRPPSATGRDAPRSRRHAPSSCRMKHPVLTMGSPAQGRARAGGSGRFRERCGDTGPRAVVELYKTSGGGGVFNVGLDLAVRSASSLRGAPGCTELLVRAAEAVLRSVPALAAGPDVLWRDQVVRGFLNRGLSGWWNKMGSPLASTDLMPRTGPALTLALTLIPVSQTMSCRPACPFACHWRQSPRTHRGGRTTTDARRARGGGCWRSSWTDSGRAHARTCRSLSHGSGHWAPARIQPSASCSR